MSTTRLVVIPNVNSRMERVWQWRVEMRDDKEHWGVVSYKTAQPALTHGDIDGYGAKGETRTRFFAIRQGHRALKVLRKNDTHLHQELTIVQDDEKVSI